jgi:hypothetical protein
VTEDNKSTSDFVDGVIKDASKCIGDDRDVLYEKSIILQDDCVRLERTFPRSVITAMTSDPGILKKSVNLAIALLARFKVVSLVNIRS